MTDEQSIFVELGETCSYEVDVCSTNEVASPVLPSKEKPKSEEALLTKESKHHWQKYSDGRRAQVPEYLAKNYWWAYLSPIGVSFFDHPFMVNRILWGQYHKIAKDTVKFLEMQDFKSLAGISCAYGEIIPLVGTESSAENIYLFDVAPIQLRQAKKKIRDSQCEDKFTVFQANAENIPLPDNSVDTALLFFLMHELPEDVCLNVQREALRITRPGGRVIMADYGQFTNRHLFHKMGLFRNIFETLEPFLGSFWHRDILGSFEVAAAAHDKQIELTDQKYYWHDFYRLWSLSVR